MTEGLVVEHLAKSFGGVRAVDDVSLQLEMGTVTGLIGPNGAGKSTVVGMLAGALIPDRGRVILAGKDITGLSAHQTAQLGVIRTFQTASVFPGLTVLENLLLGVPPWYGERVGASLWKRRRWRRDELRFVAMAESVLGRLGMDRHRNQDAGELSGGERRLVEIGRAILAKPRVLLLDEPMSGVALHLGESIAVLVEELVADGIAVALVEHEMGVIERLCSTVIVMANGRVMMQGTMEEVREDVDVRLAYLGH